MNNPSWKERDAILGRDWSALKSKGIPFNQHLPTINLYYDWQDEHWWPTLRCWFEPIEDEI